MSNGEETFLRFQCESLRDTLQPGTAFTGMEAELIGNTWKELGARKERAARHFRSKCNDIPKSRENFIYLFIFYLRSFCSSCLMKLLASSLVLLKSSSSKS